MSLKTMLLIILLQDRVVMQSIRLTNKNLHQYSDVPGAHKGPTWVLSARDGPHVGPMNLAIKVVTHRCVCEMGHLVFRYCLSLTRWSVFISKPVLTCRLVDRKTYSCLLENGGHFVQVSACLSNLIVLKLLLIAHPFISAFMGYSHIEGCYIDSKVRGANMGPIWGRQEIGRPHVGPYNTYPDDFIYNIPTAWSFDTNFVDAIVLWVYIISKFE